MHGWNIKHRRRIDGVLNARKKKKTEKNCVAALSLATDVSMLMSLYQVVSRSLVLR